ncbi:MAG: global cell cycle regulator GcrA-like protein [Brevundimonas sp.]|jgi:GcrA cell cycle regulator|uniref:GcrA family cell cycle regulator n=1 Tax=Brevundimonas sp. TaxID=1871086 RepID=UPI000DB57A53|nr:GcrA family cell cycle regulator [Brevundimonas sp.]PZU72652.1 MAG: global cell cycle regulator GcrA-like protein [Brevundimonas sp.]
MSAWTQDRIKLLKRLWPEGLSAETIARELGGGLTRNAVLGKVARLGLSEARTDARPRREGAHRDTPEPPPAGVATILSVRRTDCRWPYGEPGDAAFSLCGRPSERGAFCAAHAAIAYRPAPLSVEGLMRLAGVAH